MIRTIQSIPPIRSIPPIQSTPRIPTIRPSRGRGGFALVSVLWVIVGVTALALSATLAAREAVAAARNRADLAVAAWRAEGCLERARAAIGEALAGDAVAGRRTGWARMDRAVAESPLLAGEECEVEARAAGTALDVNAADAESLVRLFLALRLSAPAADSLADALLDWRDADDDPRPSGAEAAWYRGRGLRVPRNGPLADGREVLLVRGFESLPGIDTLLTAEPGRVSLGHAPPTVLASLPGVSAEAVARLVAARLHGAEPADLAALGGGLSPDARAGMLQRFHELSGRATAEPDAWILRARGAAGDPAAVVVAEARLVRDGARAAVVRRRTWIE